MATGTGSRTRDSFFADFFDSPQGDEESCHCGATENLVVAWTEEDGTQHWVCSACKAKQDAARASRAARAHCSVQQSLERDWDEEPSSRYNR